MTRITARSIQIVLGMVWLLDGLLQLQPYMFTSGFATSILVPVGVGQPTFVAVPVTWAVHIILHAPILWDIFFAVIQIVLGVGFLWPKTVRSAVVVSTLWGLGVWLFGEGLGGLAGGKASMLTGAPGAVILYVILGIAVWPRNDIANKRNRDDLPPAQWLPIAWAVLWLGGAILTLLPANRSALAVANLVMNQAMSAPSSLMNVDASVNNGIMSLGVVSVIILCSIQASIGIGGLFKASRTLAAYAGMVVALVFWGIGQSFGMLFSGSATDPNSGPLIIVFAVALLGLTIRKRRTHGSFISTSL